MNSTFKLTPANFIDTVNTALPEQLHLMRSYQANDITINARMSSVVLTYMHTVGGEKFRLFDRTFQGEGNSQYFDALGQDEQIITALMDRICSSLAFGEKVNHLFKKNDPLELNMVMES